jgi:cytochrome P450
MSRFHPVRGLRVRSRRGATGTPENRYLADCHRRYGDIFTLRVAPAGTLVCLADPDDIKQVFTGDRDIFHAGEGNSLLAPVMGSHSVLVPTAHGISSSDSECCPRSTATASAPTSTRSSR